MTPKQADTIKYFQNHINKVNANGQRPGREWTMTVEERNDSYGELVTISISSNKWHDRTIQGRIGERGAFYQWTVDDDLEFHSKSQRVSTLASVYIR